MKVVSNLLTKICLLLGGMLIAGPLCMAQDTAISSKSPSSDVSNPTPIQLGEIVKGRLANSSETGKYHFWLVDIPVGSYKIVLDIRRADEKVGNIGGSLQMMSLEGQKLDGIGGVNELDDRWRSIFRFGIKKPLKFIIRYENGFTVSDYWLGIFRQADLITSPYFARCPNVEQVKLGQPVNSVLDGSDNSQATMRDAYYSIKLWAGDYKFSINFARADRTKGNVGGSVTVLSSEGDSPNRIFYINDMDFSSKNISKISLADEAVLLVKVRAFFTKEMATLTVEKIPD